MLDLSVVFWMFSTAILSTRKNIRLQVEEGEGIATSAAYSAISSLIAKNRKYQLIYPNSALKLICRLINSKSDQLIETSYVISLHIPDGFLFMLLAGANIGRFYKMNPQL